MKNKIILCKGLKLKSKFKNMKAKVKFKTVDLNSVHALTLAEKLQANGWTIISIGFNTVTFEKK